MADRVDNNKEVRPGALRWGAILFTVAGALVIWPLWQPLLLAAWFAVSLLARWLNFTRRILSGKRRAAAVLTV